MTCTGNHCRRWGQVWGVSAWITSTSQATFSATDHRETGDKCAPSGHERLCRTWPASPQDGYFSRSLVPEADDDRWPKYLTMSRVVAQGNVVDTGRAAIPETEAARR